MAAKELKPCPFCGSDDIVYQNNSLFPCMPQYWYCECCNCQTITGSMCHLSKEEAAKAWNRRPDTVEVKIYSAQQLKAEILPIVDRALLDVIDGDCDKAILSLNKLTAKLSAV